MREQATLRQQGATRVPSNQTPSYGEGFCSARRSSSRGGGAVSSSVWPSERREEAEPLVGADAGGGEAGGGGGGGGEAGGGDGEEGSLGNLVRMTINARRWRERAAVAAIRARVPGGARSQAEAGEGGAARGPPVTSLSALAASVRELEEGEGVATAEGMARRRWWQRYGDIRERTDVIGRRANLVAAEEEVQPASREPAPRRASLVASEAQLVRR